MFYEADVFQVNSVSLFALSLCLPLLVSSSKWQQFTSPTQLTDNCGCNSDAETRLVHCEVGRNKLSPIAITLIVNYKL